MAERAKRRLKVAKVSVSVAVAAVLAGLVARDKSPETVAYELAGAQPHMVPPTITTGDIKDGTLLYRDFKRGQVYSQKMADNLFMKEKIADRTFYKVQDANDTFLQKADAAKTYVKIDDANSRFVNGDGRVFTGAGSSQGALIGLLDLPGLASVQGNHPATGGLDTVRVTNTSGSPIEISPAGSGNGIIAVDKSVDLTINGGTPLTVQMLVPAVQKIATLTVSSIPAGGGADFVAQGLVGAP
jgi:hypothetical protein